MSTRTSSTAAMLATAYGPACTRHDPLSSIEALQVHTWRARGLGWDACAKMVGRSTPDVRAHCDPNYQRPYQPARPIVQPKAPPAPTPVLKDHRGGRAPGVTDERRKIMLALKSGERTSRGIGMRLELSPHRVSSHLHKLDKVAWVRKDGGSWNEGFEWALTEAGLQALAEGLPRG